MSLLLIVICGIFLCQPTVNGVLNSLSILCSGRTGRWWWLLGWRFWHQQELSARKKDNRALQKGWCAYKDSIMQYCRNYFTILQENDGAASQCSKETVSFLNAHTQEFKSICTISEKTAFLNFRLKVEDDNDERSFKVCKLNLYTKVQFKW